MQYFDPSNSIFLLRCSCCSWIIVTNMIMMRALLLLSLLVGYQTEDLNVEDDDECTQNINEDPFAKYNLMFIGKTMQEAREILENNIIKRPAGNRVTDVRAMKINGIPQLVTMDFRSDRMNVELYDKIIVKIVHFL